MATTDSAPTYKGSEFIRLATGSSRDILIVLLEPDKPYTEAQVEQLVSDYLEKEVRK